jgi:hypothetical protein
MHSESPPPTKRVNPTTQRKHHAAATLPTALPEKSLPLLLALLLLLILPLSSAAQSMAPPAPTPLEPILPAFGGLSDGGPVLSPYIDRLAFNARVDLLFVADSGRQQHQIVVPYGLSFSALHLVEGGVSTHGTFWREDEHERSYSAPRSLYLKARLWPWFKRDPNQHGTVVAAYQHEVRTGPFDGPNQLGLLTDLGALRIAASWPLGPVDLGASVGALYDYQGRYATGEFGARLGLRLDFLGLPDNLTQSRCNQ